MIAVLDLGTNTFHLLIAERKEGRQWRKVYKERITVKLGQGGIGANLIAPRAFKRGIAAIRQFHTSITNHPVQKVVAYGTAALRTASNGQQFIDEVRKKFAIDIRLISGEEEAELIYLGVQQAVKPGARKSLIMDIGGGSVEFIIADANGIHWKQSYKLGAALLLETLKPGDPFTPGDVERFQAYLESGLQSLFDAAKLHEPVRIIGSAGSFETFASMIRHRFPASGSHYGKTAHPLEWEHIESLYRDLITSSRSERIRMKGLIRMRVDMIVIAVLLLNFVVVKTGIKTINLSAYSLKEGALWREMTREPDTMKGMN